MYGWSSSGCDWRRKSHSRTAELSIDFEQQIGMISSITSLPHDIERVEGLRLHTTNGIAILLDVLVHNCALSFENKEKHLGNSTRLAVNSLVKIIARTMDSLLRSIEV